jgi:hypothetical protein
MDLKQIDRKQQILKTIQQVETKYPHAYNDFVSRLKQIETKDTSIEEIKRKIGILINGIPPGHEKDHLLTLFNIKSPSFDGLKMTDEEMEALLNEYIPHKGGNRKYKRKSFRKKKSRQRRTRCRK